MSRGEIWMYHHVVPAPLSPPPRHPRSYVTPEDFERHLDLLATAGYRAVALRDRPTARGRRVVITFDDACRCLLDHAVPALQRRGFRATIFAVAGALGGTNHWDHAAGERREDLMDATQLAELAAAGFEIGCHSARHLDLTTLDGRALRDETAGARARLEAALDQPVTSFAYPYGRVNPAARAAVMAAGFTAAVGIVDHGISRPGDPLALPRWPVGPGESTLELRLKASGAYRWWRRLPRLGVLAALRGRRVSS